VTTINPVIGIATRLKVGSFVYFSRASKWMGNHATMIEKRFIFIYYIDMDLKIKSKVAILLNTENTASLISRKYL
jgi:hypothetical protein